MFWWILANGRSCITEKIHFQDRGTPCIVSYTSGRPIGIFTYINYNYISETNNNNLGLNLKATDTPKIPETPIIP